MRSKTDPTEKVIQYTIIYILWIAWIRKVKTSNLEIRYFDYK